ncbi:MAG: hypothetical protein QG652_788 [Pseudomonadota bacterium]|nr:hypothetical protein [Pseudomonadota bacterium]
MNRRRLSLLFIFTAISALYFLAVLRSQPGLSDQPLVLHTTPPEIIMFGTQSCGYCRQARQFFEKHHLPYTERDIEASDEHRKNFDLLGGRGTPLLIINRQLLHGFDEQAVRKAL